MFKERGNKMLGNEI